MQSAYLCNHAIHDYEASDLNPTIAAILHLNPPTSSALLLFATRRGLLGFLAGIAFPAPNPEQVEKLRNAVTWCGARAPARHPNHRPASEDGAEEGALRPHSSPWPRRTLPASPPWEREGGQTGAAVHARLRRRSPRGGAADGAGRSSSPAAPAPPCRPTSPRDSSPAAAAAPRRATDGGGGPRRHRRPWTPPRAWIRRPSPSCRAAKATVPSRHGHGRQGRSAEAARWGGRRRPPRLAMAAAEESMPARRGSPAAELAACRPPPRAPAWEERPSD